MSTAANLNAQFSLTGSATYIANALGLTNQARAALAAGDWSSAITGFSYGSADTVSGNNGLGQVMYAAQRSVAGGANDDIDLNGVLQMAGVSQNFARVKFILIQIVSPDGTKVLRVGPQGVANAWQGPFGGTGATVYKEVVDWELIVNHKWAGYAVTAGTADILRVNNPGGGVVSYNILIIGR